MSLLGERPRKLNDAQVLTIGSRELAPRRAEKVLDHWLQSECEEAADRRPKVKKLEVGGGRSK